MMKPKSLKFILSVCVFFAISCKTKKTIDSTAKKIIDTCIETHGGNNYQNLDVSFDFRKFRIKISNHGSQFKYERMTQDSLKREIHDILQNAGFSREVNHIQQNLSPQDASKYSESINAIAYFVLLPFKLSDPAVHSEKVGTIVLDNQTYDKIKVGFDAEGGGKDHQDVFCYWINQKSHTLDYLAYSNGGPRFRKAIKRDTCAGIIFQNYENYEVLDTTIGTSNYDKAFLSGKIKLLSKIEQSNYISNR